MNTLRPKICATKTCGTKPGANLAQRAFTLIELLVVIAVTAVLFSLLIIPLISALRFNQQAQSVTASQDASRVTREGLTRELGSAVFVFDGTSHPFTIPAGTVVSPGDDRYTNFLDLQIPGINGTGQYTPTVAHVYNAKLDFVLPKPSTTGTTDPTTGEQVAYRSNDNGSAIISSPALVFPPAPGTTMVRYWVGLKNPDAAYYNVRERLGTGSTNNTYILYRAQFSPYTITRDANNVQTGIALNTDLFTPTTPNGSLPELDDPDFFRTVTTSDVNWLNSTHANYTATEMSDHNARVENWIKIAKPVIPGPNVDLLALPHKQDNTLAYDPQTVNPPSSSNIPGVAHSGAARDPITGTVYPIVNTTVTFRPGTVSGDATPGTTASYTSQGAVSVGANGFGYTPTVYTTTSKSWSLPYHVSLYPANFDGANTADDRGVYYDTQLAPRSGAFTAGNGTVTVSVGDVMEYRHVGSADTTGRLVYDVTQGFAVSDTGSGYGVGGTNFIPMSINPDTGTINFAAASLPNGPADRYTREWVYPTPNANGTVDLTMAPPASVAVSPLAGGTPTSPTGVANAHLVPGSVRVFGPDQTAGPGAGLKVAYQEVQPNSSAFDTQAGDNQFSIDYATGVLTLKPNAPGPVGVTYEYQANMTRTDPTKSLDEDNPYQPMQVKVDYQTRDLIDVSLGVRIYDVTTGRAQILPSDTRIKIGNSNR